VRPADVKAPVNAVDDTSASSTVRLDSAAMRHFVTAIRGDASAYETAGVAHPLAVAAMSMPLLAAVVEHAAPSVGWDEVLHAEQQLEVSRALAADEEIDLTATWLPPRPYGTRAALAIDVTVHDGDGLRAMQCRSILALPGGVASGAPWVRAPRPRPGTRIERRSTTVDAALVQQYADASGDRNPIHLHDDAARAAGFDRPIAHGMLVAGLAWSLCAEIIEGSEPNAVRAMHLRFVRPVMVDDTVEFEVRRGTTPSDLVVNGRTDRGTVIKSGVFCPGRPSQVDTASGMVSVDNTN
jgi:acyl dehydratase